MQRHRVLFASLLCLCLCAVSLPVLAVGAVDTGLDQTAKTAFGGATLKSDLPTIVGFFIKTALSFIGVIFMVLVVFGGFLYMTAGGNDQKLEKAKGIITSAIIGMVIIAAGYAITEFVIRTVQSATVVGADQAAPPPAP